MERIREWGSVRWREEMGGPVQIRREREPSWLGLKISREIRPAIGTGYSFQPVPMSRASTGTGSWHDPMLMSAP